MMKRYRLLSMMTMTLAVGACATPPVSNDLGIETASGGQFLPGANCTVQTVEGIFNVVTPATVPARNTPGDLRVVCDRPGYRTSEVVYRGLGYGVGDLPIAERAAFEFVSLPMYPELTSAQINKVVDAVIETLGAAVPA